MHRIRPLLLLLLLSSLAGCSASRPGQAAHPAAGDLVITWALISNQVADRPRHRAVFTFVNRGEVALGPGGWTLYFNQLTRRILPPTIQGPALIEQINGDFYRLRPTAGFLLPPGDSLRITFDAEEWMIKYCDAPTGLYFVFDEGGAGEEIAPVTRYTVLPFTRPEQIDRFTGDGMPIPTPAYRFSENERLSPEPPAGLPPLIPQPREIRFGEGAFTLGADAAISYEGPLAGEANLLTRSLGAALAAPPRVAAGGARQAIHLAVDAGAVTHAAREAYLLDISPAAVTITGSDAAGVFYGIQSLLALLPPDAWRTRPAVAALPACRITDAPRFGYRGLHLDVARHFHPPAAVKKLLDAMAFYKLNTLHLDLSSEEGWRLAIDALPELTEVGARRGHTLDDAEFLQPAFGSGPFPDPARSYANGFYSREDFKDILRYARERHIEVIPEVNFPGHNRAVIKAMEARYRRLAARGDTVAAEAYRLSDPGDASRYRSPQHFTDNVVCVCRESTYRFFETVLDDIIAMYREAGVPLRMFHTGGDEVPAGAWTRSPLCRQFLAANPAVGGVDGLQPYFLRRVNRLLADRGLLAGGWEEAALKKTGPDDYAPNPEFAGGPLQAYVWNSLWGNQDLGYRLANAGYPVVLCNVTNFYFDLAYDKDPEEPGLYWGGFCNTRQAWEFNPFDLFKSMRRDDMGHLFDPDADFAGMERLRPDARGRILGLQGQLWGETIKNPEMLEYYYLPKMLGLAERAWAPAPAWESVADRTAREQALDAAWNAFAHAVGRREMPRLDHIFGGFNYRLAPPGARLADGRLHANTDFPGPAIRYTTDGSEPNANSTLYTAPVTVTGPVRLKVFDTRGRASRTTWVGKPND